MYKSSLLVVGNVIATTRTTTRLVQTPFIRRQHPCGLNASRALSSASVTPPPISAHSTSVLEFPEQRVLAGNDCLRRFVQEVQQGLTLGGVGGTTTKRPLLVSDKGVSGLGLVKRVIDELKSVGLQPTVFDETQPNPSVEDVKKIASAFLKNNCDVCVGVGGGGPLDAMKGGMALIARQRTALSSFDVDKEGSNFLTNQLKPLLSKIPSDYAAAVPAMAALPTTAGTGSEGGKSAVITNPEGKKFVFGNPVFFPRLVGLIPSFTEKMPPSLTASTGVDALFHLLEAYFVTDAAAHADGLDDGGIMRCDSFALSGTRLVAQWLPVAFKEGTNLEARLNMQVAALYGAKAFRKGDLGGVHACAHAIGAYYHLHHGTSIARMAIPVLTWNERWCRGEGGGAEAIALKKKMDKVVSLFNEAGVQGDSAAEVVESFLKVLNLSIGLKGLKASPTDLDQLADMAAADGCQTNPVALTRENYRAIFESSV